MIPSLVASEIRSALIDYLATTFSLGDDDVSDALAEFLTDPREGIFRGPYLRVRTPFRSVDSSWTSPLGWLPDGFLPYEHQATAFERLSSVAGRSPQPTLVTTGTGSGKTECFLMPILDHCARERAAGKAGIKALILYPMNALASDQAGRIAAMIREQSHLAGVTAGIYIGENGSHSSMGDDHLIDDRYALRADPPDILLTNYKMLDFLLLRRADHDLWATNSVDSLSYVVLDEFHTYDGAQGTDVAMLLRRLGATLGMATKARPLGNAAPVATSATLGSEPSAIVDLREFAGKVFGVEFEADSVIGETRQTIEEACGPVDNLLPIPTVKTLREVLEDDTEGLAAAFCQKDDGSMPVDRVELGTLLLAHPLTRAVLAAVDDRPRSLDETVTEIIGRIPVWAVEANKDRNGVTEALGRYLALLSVARRLVGSRTVPLFSVEVQLWVREISRLLRSVETTTQFRWLDTPAIAALPTESDGEDESGSEDAGQPADGPLVAGVPELELPAVYCRKCGHAGWMALTSELHETLLINPANVYRSAFERSASVRVLLRANPADPRALHLDPTTRRIEKVPGELTMPVYVTTGEDAARQQRCPACEEQNAIRFIGLAVASLASVSINTMFGSPNVAPDEQKLLAFTDSVQDASHRAAFFAGRTHRFNLRSLMSASLQDAGEAGLSLADLGDELMASATTARERYGLVPPDLQRETRLRSLWSDEPESDALEILSKRIGFEVDLEFGLRARVGRTLEQSVAAVARVDLGDPDEVHHLAFEALGDELSEVPVTAAAGLDGYLLGLAERLRTNGAIHNLLLEPYVAEAGKQWFIWGGRPRGLPPFTPDQGRPMFATTATKSFFDSLSAVGPNPTWFVDWAMRSLGLSPEAAQAVNRRVVSTLSEATEAIVKVEATGGQRIYGLDRRAVRAVDITDMDGLITASVVRCDLCAGMHTVAPVDHERWVGIPCRRYRCP
ncbi:MAG TPA: DEAD/DEAH box helicase, partial [Microthrixaceae bacterium]|nr:DEAD/DEAH box helicase [Microthrixaceae bacterium]